MRRAGRPSAPRSLAALAAPLVAALAACAARPAAAPAPTAVAAAGAPAAIGPYAQAVVHDGLVYCSGQIALDPTTGELVGDDVAAQTRRVLESLRAVLRAAGSDLEHVVQATVYLADLGDFAAMNAVYATYFDADPRPARATVEVAALPRGALVEIACVAAAPRAGR